MGAGGVTDADFDDTGGFDSAEKIQILLKGLLNVPSTQIQSIRQLPLPFLLGMIQV
jgi:hypothetical protein